MLAILGTPHRQREKISENKGGWVPFIFAMIGRPAGRIPAPSYGNQQAPALTRQQPRGNHHQPAEKHAKVCADAAVDRRLFSQFPRSVAVTPNASAHSRRRDRMPEGYSE